MCHPRLGLIDGHEPLLQSSEVVAQHFGTCGRLPHPHDVEAMDGEEGRLVRGPTERCQPRFVVRVSGVAGQVSHDPTVLRSLLP